ncbi:branched-chain amino acid ABC transporter permease [Haloarchaeobius sp. DFWS5]|uniref:branched-chain amino acid ABC transporter permease n=1 Tax=Haloarchaeobius sp. DFWS5 TaxID=3446114 RepID=UPI003EBC3F20
MATAEDIRERLPIGSGTIGGLLVAVSLVFLLTPLFVQPPGWTLTFFEDIILFLLFGFLVVGLNLQFGHTGLVNFGHVAFFAVGGYTAAMLTANDPLVGVGLGFPWPVGLIGAVVAAAALGALIGASTLRLRGDFLAIVTLAIAEILHDLLGSFQGITGGDVSLQNVPRPIADLAGTAGASAMLTTVLFAGLLLVTYAVFHRLSESPYGRVLRAIRADERVTQTLGKNVFGYKFWAFVYGAAIAGVAGALYAFNLGSVSPGFFTISVTVTVWVGMLVGGPGNDWAAIIGVGIIVGFRLATRFLNEQVPAISADQFASVRLMLVGLLLILIIRYRPQGLWGDAGKLGVDQ